MLLSYYACDLLPSFFVRCGFILAGFAACVPARTAAAAMKRVDVSLARYVFRDLEGLGRSQQVETAEHAISRLA